MTLKSIEKYFARYTEPRAYPWVSDMLRDIQDEVDSRYMELPVDADGVPIRVGDSLRLIKGDVVVVEAVDAHGAVVWCNEEFEHLSGDWCRHVNPRTVEDVLREMVEGYNDDGSWDTPEEFISRYATELRDLMGVDR